MLQRLAVQQLHDNEGVTVRVADVIHRTDVGVLQSRHRSGFALESLTDLQCIDRLRGDHLDRDVSTETTIAGLIDLPHRTGAEQRSDLVWTEAGAGVHAKVVLA